MAVSQLQSEVNVFQSNYLGRFLIFKDIGQILPFEKSFNIFLMC